MESWKLRKNYWNWSENRRNCGQILILSDFQAACKLETKILKNHTNAHINKQSELKNLERVSTSNFHVL